jgi:hypothetical protein
MNIKNTAYILILLVAFVLLIQSCTKNNSQYNSPTTTYYYLTSAELNQTPYFTNKAFDTISFASDKGDTLTFVKTKTDTTWYCEPTTNNPDNKDQNCYQTLHNTYTIIKGNGSFEVMHIKENTSQYINILKINFKNYTFYTGDYAINDISHPRYLGDVIKNNKTFFKSMFTFNNFTDSASSICNLNKDYGAYFFYDKINNIKYLIDK